MDKAIYSKGREDIKAKETMLPYHTQPNYQTFNYVALHRGFSEIAPENTMSAYRLASRYNAIAIESDVQISSDGVVVCIHDSTVDRTTDGTGNVSDKTLSELRSLDAGSWFHSKFQNERIPTLEEYLNIAYRSKMIPYIDLKLDVSDIYKVVDMVESFNSDRHTITNCGTQEKAEKVRSLNDNIMVSYYSGSLTQDEVDWANLLGNAFLSVNVSDVTETKMEYANSKNVPVEIWTVNSMQEMEQAFKLGAKSVLSDAIPNIRGYGKWN